MPIGHDREPAPHPASPALHLRRPDPNGAGPNGEEFHAFTKIARTTSWMIEMHHVTGVRDDGD